MVEEGGQGGNNKKKSQTDIFRHSKGVPTDLLDVEIETQIAHCVHAMSILMHD